MNNSQKPIYKVVLLERIGEYEAYRELFVRGTLRQAKSHATNIMREYYGEDTRKQGDEFWDVSGERFVQLSSITPASIQFFDAMSEEYEHIELLEAVQLEAENGRLREALEHIAQGNISPAITFAKYVLAGSSVDAAHKVQVAMWD